MAGHPSEAEIADAATRLGRLRDVLQQVLFDQEEFIELSIAGLLARGHILLEGLPGLGKTELANGISRALALASRRIQFTPDLLPGDITGNPILEERDGERRFVFQPGPIFANLVLADEINRASPKTQSALLEAMQERRVSVLGETRELPAPFFVIATQNPIELEGTYPLPEAQLDRFLFKLVVRPPGAATLARIIAAREIGEEPPAPEVMDRDALLAMQDLVRRVHMPEPVADWIAHLVAGTHPPEQGEPNPAAALIRHGASPRAALALAAGARALALLAGRPHAAFEDVERLALPVLRHRITLDYAARVEGEDDASVIARLLQAIPAAPLDLPSTLKEAPPDAE